MGRIQELRRKLGLPEVKQPKQLTPEQASSLKSSVAAQLDATRHVRQESSVRIRKNPSLLFQALLDVNLYQIDPLDFESLLKLTFQIFGFTAALTPTTGDHGVDIRLVSPSNSLSVVQCKRYSKEQPVSAREVRELLGSIKFFNAEFGFFVTTSYFTEQCKEFCTNQPIFLIDLRTLKRLLLFAETVELNRESYTEVLKYPEKMVTDFLKQSNPPTRERMF